MPLLECLADLRDTMNDPHFREIIANLVESIEGGKKLSQAMAQHPDAFDKIFVSLTHAGEESGRLPEVFQHITESLKWQDEMASHTKTIMIYPALVGTVVIGNYVFPDDLSGAATGQFHQGHGTGNSYPDAHTAGHFGVFRQLLVCIARLPVVLFALQSWPLTAIPEMQYHLDNFKLHMWPTGPILRKIILARFANTFAMMYGSGISILDCIANSRDVVNNQVIAKSLEDVMHEIESGKNLTQSFQNTGMFPPLVIRMLKVGEATGCWTRRCSTSVIFMTAT